jgi:photosystem II oxygen-evolving enhancer protein 1
MHSEFNFKKAAAGLAALPLAFFLSQSAGALTTQDLRDLTYGQIKGTGIANRCPEVASADKAQEITLDKGSKYKIVDMCLEPKSFQIEEEIQKRKGEIRKGEPILFCLSRLCK